VCVGIKLTMKKRLQAAVIAKLAITAACNLFQRNYQRN